MKGSVKDEKKKKEKLAKSGSNELGQIKFKVLGQEFEIPVKIRVEGNFIPSFTIDPTKKSTGVSILDIIKPRVTVLIGTTAYTFEYGGKVRKADPRIFQQPTLLDQLAEAGILPTLVFIGGAMFFLYRMVKMAGGR